MGSGAAYLPPKLSAQLMKVMPKGVDFGEGALLRIRLAMTSLTGTNKFRLWNVRRSTPCSHCDTRASVLTF
jgi:hypothetical protein